jgi:GT2 family glycosyltransferase
MRLSAMDLARAIYDPTWVDMGDVSEDEAFINYLAAGARPPGDPHPLFSVEHYLAQAPELLETDESPLLHFVSAGWRRGLSPHPLFDVVHYVRSYGGDLDENEDPLSHYLRQGSENTKRPNAWFDPAYYNHTYEDVRESMDPLIHFAVFGGREGRRPNKYFDAVLHRSRHRLPAEVNPLTDFLARLAAARAQSAVPVEPEFSVVILNYNKALMTLQGVVAAFEDPIVGQRSEVIVVDNGSSPAEYALLKAQLPSRVRLVRLDENRFFGEGNNVGAEAARGRFVVFLNNDAFLEPGALEALRAVFDRFPDCGAVGPRFLYPDGRVQESGAMVSPCGIATQRGKFLAQSNTIYTRTEPVDYVSAACVMLRRETFDEVGGFDLIWDPAYYEDTDLGLKIKLLGKRVYYCPDAAVIHIENATSGDSSLALRLDGIVEVNRDKFVARWSEYLTSGQDPATARIAFPARERRASDPSRRVAVLYTPYPLYPGGGERYLLTIAEALRPRYDVLLATPERYSTWRIRTIGRDLQLDVSHVTPIAARELPRYAACDLFVAMGNELYPPVAAQGRHAIYHCQFPFPMHAQHVAHNGRFLSGYEAVIVNSAFTARNYRAEAARYGELPPPVRVIAPPVPQLPPSVTTPGAARIVHVGRFSPAGHSKRQDVLVEAFRILVERHPAHAFELHLAGTVPADASAREFLLAVRKRARDLPVQFHLNTASDELHRLYASAAVYWHATGYDDRGVLNPEVQEHFGISVVEAMSAGCVPMVYRGGGPAEFLDPGVTGYLWSSPAELAGLTEQFMAQDAQTRAVMAARVRAEARLFEPARFASEVTDLLAELERGDAPSRNGHGEARVVVRDIVGM